MKSNFLWHYLLKWIYLVYTNGLLLVFSLEVMILQLYASSRYCWHSLLFTLASPTPLRQKKNILFFQWSKKFHSHVRKTIRPIRIWAVYFLIKNFFFPNLACSKSQYVHVKPTYIHTHFKQFGPGKPLTFSKYTTKISSPQLPVGETTIICA